MAFLTGTRFFGDAMTFAMALGLGNPNSQAKRFAVRVHFPETALAHSLRLRHISV
jgi:hypothetical protein